ncbi:MAG: CDP-alcohol phosphatidyltransferase family protein [Pseudomonadota bacterium]
MTGDRRPLASRGTRWAGAAARWLATTGVTPNRISQASVVAAALAGLCLWLGPAQEGPARTALLLAAAVFIQLRLLCNLMDGMVAVEGARGAPDGPFWNEVPDRIADILILIGCGYGVGLPELGWAAATFAVLTAYIREFGRAQGQPSDFCGPMAKPHRMAALTLGAVIAAFEHQWGWNGLTLQATLWVVAIGALVTAFRRALRLLGAMR